MGCCSSSPNDAAPPVTSSHRDVNPLESKLKPTEEVHEEENEEENEEEEEIEEIEEHLPAEKTVSLEDYHSAASNFFQAAANRHQQAPPPVARGGGGGQDNDSNFFMVTPDVNSSAEGGKKSLRQAAAVASMLHTSVSVLQSIASSKKSRSRKGGGSSLLLGGSQALKEKDDDGRMSMTSFGRLSARFHKQQQQRNIPSSKISSVSGGGGIASSTISSKRKKNKSETQTVLELQNQQYQLSIYRKVLLDAIHSSFVSSADSSRFSFMTVLVGPTGSGKVQLVMDYLQAHSAANSPSFSQREEGKEQETKSKEDEEGGKIGDENKKCESKKEKKLRYQFHWIVNGESIVTLLQSYQQMVVALELTSGVSVNVFSLLLKASRPVEKSGDSVHNEPKSKMENMKENDVGKKLTEPEEARRQQQIQIQAEGCDNENNNTPTNEGSASSKKNRRRKGGKKNEIEGGEEFISASWSNDQWIFTFLHQVHSALAEVCFAQQREEDEHEKEEEEEGKTEKEKGRKSTENKINFLLMYNRVAPSVFHRYLKPVFMAQLEKQKVKQEEQQLEKKDEEVVRRTEASVELGFPYHLLMTVTDVVESNTNEKEEQNPSFWLRQSLKAFFHLHTANNFQRELGIVAESNPLIGGEKSEKEEGSSSSDAVLKTATILLSGEKTSPDADFVYSTADPSTLISTTPSISPKRRNDDQKKETGAAQEDVDVTAQQQPRTVSSTSSSFALKFPVTVIVVPSLPTPDATQFFIRVLQRPTPEGMVKKIPLGQSKVDESKNVAEGEQAEEGEKEKEEPEGKIKHYVASPVSKEDQQQFMIRLLFSHFSTLLPSINDGDDDGLMKKEKVSHDDELANNLIASSREKLNEVVTYFCARLPILLSTSAMLLHCWILLSSSTFVSKISKIDDGEMKKEKGREERDISMGRLEVFSSLQSSLERLLMVKNSNQNVWRNASFSTTTVTVLIPVMMQLFSMRRKGSFNDVPPSSPPQIADKMGEQGERNEKERDKSNSGHPFLCFDDVTLDWLCIQALLNQTQISLSYFHQYLASVMVSHRRRCRKTAANMRPQHKGGIQEEVQKESSRKQDEENSKDDNKNQVNCAQEAEKKTSGGEEIFLSLQEWKTQVLQQLSSLGVQCTGDVNLSTSKRYLIVHPAILQAVRCVVFHSPSHVSQQGASGHQLPSSSKGLVIEQQTSALLSKFFQQLRKAGKLRRTKRSNRGVKHKNVQSTVYFDRGEGSLAAGDTAAMVEKELRELNAIEEAEIAAAEKVKEEGTVKNNSPTKVHQNNDETVSGKTPEGEMLKQSTSGEEAQYQNNDILQHSSPPCQSESGVLLDSMSEAAAPESDEDEDEDQDDTDDEAIREFFDIVEFYRIGLGFFNTLQSLYSTYSSSSEQEEDDDIPVYVKQLKLLGMISVLQRSLAIAEREFKLYRDLSTTMARHTETIELLEKAISEIHEKKKISDDQKNFADDDKNDVHPSTISHHWIRMALDFSSLFNSEISSHKDLLGKCYYCLGQYEKALAQHKAALTLPSSDKSTSGKKSVHFGEENEGEGDDNEDDENLTRRNLLGEFPESDSENESDDHDGEDQDENEDDVASRSLPPQLRTGANKKAVKTAVTKKNIALCQISMGKFSEALETYKSSLAMWSDVLNTNFDQSEHHHCDGVVEKKVSHPEVALSLNNIGTCTYCLGQYQDALIYHEQALTMNKDLYIGQQKEGGGLTVQALQGASHPAIAISTGNVADCHYSLGSYTKAVSWYEDSLALWKTLYGGEAAIHPDVLQTLLNIGDSCYAQEEYAKAHKFYKDALRMSEKLYANLVPKKSAMKKVKDNKKKKETESLIASYPLHVDVGASLNGMALCLAQFPWAREDCFLTFRQAREIYVQTVGVHHVFVQHLDQDVAICKGDLKIK